MITTNQNAGELDRLRRPFRLPRSLGSAARLGRDQVAPIGLDDPAALLVVTKISIWARWLITAIVVALLAYRPGFWYPEAIEYLFLPAALLIVNGGAHYLAYRQGQVSRRLVGSLCVFDVAMITFVVVVGGGFTGYAFVAYYPAIAYVTVIFSSPWLGAGWALGVSLVYVIACVLAGAGIDMEAGKEKVLVARVAAMLIIGPSIGALTRFELRRWRQSIERERLLRERIVDISRSVHDSTAQTISMINVGLYRARAQAESSNDELLSTLDSTAELSRSALWNLRGPIDAGQIVSDKPISQILRSHCDTFERITSLPTAFKRDGDEPKLSVDVKGALLSIAHNALTNVSLHAKPANVSLELRFEDEVVVLLVSDDGIGLPGDYAERGRGFDGMRIEAQRLGGRLTASSGAGQRGTSVRCEIPYHWQRTEST